MHAPRPRPTSRSSTGTILESSPPSSWSGRMPSQPSSRTSTSVWSDNGTEMPQEKDSVTVVGGPEQDEAPLIDFEEEGVLGSGREAEPTPGDKLRMLLSQMDAEIRSSTPGRFEIKQMESEVEPERENQGGRGGWVGGRRRVYAGLEERSGSPSPPPSPEMEEESPPTPPPRITRAYLNPGRKISGEVPVDQITSPPPVAPVRIPSRAAALHASTSRITSSPSQLQPPHSPTPLETFIANHPAPLRLHYSNPSSSRSFDRSSTSSTSRKGKARAQAVQGRTPRPSRYAPVHSSSELSDHATRRRQLMTPRRVSIELAPDDSEVFVRGAQDMEVRGEVELDLDELSGEPPPWAETDESEVEGGMGDSTERGVRANSREASPQVMVSSEIRPRPSITETSLPHRRSRGTSFPLPDSTHSQDAKRLSRSTNMPRLPSVEPVLPALPEPEPTQFTDDEDDVDTLSSRRAALFRSTSRSSPGLSQSPSTNTTRASQGLSIPRQEPIRVGMALVSTPQRDIAGLGSTISTLTPHPPGRWQSSPPAHRGSVRFSPRTPDTDRISASDRSRSEVPVRRIKLSPLRNVTPTTNLWREPIEDAPDGDDSISRLVSRRPIPRPSTTLREAQSALTRAAEATTLAKAKVERTQRQWLEALSTVQNGNAVEVMRKGWSWGTWAWWISMELLLLWSVFRVTVDYATSTHYLSSLDPFGPSNLALSIPLPTAISAFVIPHRHTANFFDLIEHAELWRYFGIWKEIGDLRVIIERGRVEGVKMMGGVPT